MAETTLFQKILSGEIPGNFVGRGENWAAFLDVFPRADGHTLVVPVNPVQRLAELSKSDLADLFDGVKQVQNTLSAYFETKDFTVIIHDGPMAGQEIPHVHVHVIPRVEDDRGLALPAMFPEVNPANPPDYPGLAELCTKIEEASK
jgi:histidine triad (HIT) family protein|tara:strand:+ start:718 stop:1155 length:438 start_codon:yes stop_codon:yes gene_type:complete